MVRRIREAADRARDRAREKATSAVQRAKRKATVENAKKVAQEAAARQQEFERRSRQTDRDPNTAKDTFARAEDAATMGPPTMATLDPMGSPESVEGFASIGSDGGEQTNEPAPIEQMALMGGGGGGGEDTADAAMGGFDVSVGFGGGESEQAEESGMALDVGFDLGFGGEK